MFQYKLVHPLASNQRIVDVCSHAEPKFSLAMMALCVSCAGLQKSAVGSHHPKKSDAVNPNPAPSSPMLISAFLSQVMCFSNKAGKK